MTRTLKTLNTWSELSKIMKQPIGIIFNITHAMQKPNQMSTEGRKERKVLFILPYGTVFETQRNWPCSKK